MLDVLRNQELLPPLPCILYFVGWENLEQGQVLRVVSTSELLYVGTLRKGCGKSPVESEEEDSVRSIKRYKLSECNGWTLSIRWHLVL